MIVPAIISVDIARYGDEKTRITDGQGMLVWERPAKDSNALTVAHTIIQIIKRDIAIVRVVRAGIGHAIVDQLQQDGWQVVAVDHL